MNLLDDVLHFDLKKDMGLYNLTDEFFCVVLEALLKKNNQNILVVVDSLFEANKLYNLLNNYNDNVYLFPMDDFLTSEALAISPDLMITRLETIHVLNSNKRCIVVTNLMGYLRFLPNHDTYLNHIISLKVGDVISPKELVQKLVSIGYSRDTIVNKTGEFGVRGYVVDVFPIDEESPIRIEFFDDEIESIRFFDSDSQKSISSIDSISILPFSEFITFSSVSEEHSGKQKFLPLYDDVKNILDYMGGCYTFFKDYNLLTNSYLNIMNEVSTYKEDKDTDLDHSIADEAAEREAKDVELEQAIADEAAARQVKDVEIEGKLLTEEGTEFDKENGILTLKSAAGTNDITVQFSFNFGEI